jgi:hypothetical protein
MRGDSHAAQSRPWRGLGVDFGSNVERLHAAVTIKSPKRVEGMTGANWSQQAYIKASNTDAGDRFGYSLRIDDKTLAVGATRESSAATGVNGNDADDTAVNAGAVYVFR